MKKSNSKIIIFYIVLILGIFLVLSFLFANKEVKNPTYGEIIDYFEKDHVQSFVVDDSNHLILKVYDQFTESGDLLRDPTGKVVSTTKEVGFQLPSRVEFEEQFSEYFMGETANKNLSVTECDIQPEKQTPIWLAFLPYIIVILVFVILYFVIARKAAGGQGGAGKMMNFGKARVKTADMSKNRVLFKDVAGADEEKEELEEVVEFLKDPQKFCKLGAKIPHGVLLVGPPGTGKTLLAKAVAGEAGVPFFSISGSDFVEMYVGVGASRVRDLFENARKTPASIIFIDEIDAVGRHRGAGLGGGHDEREQTLNQLLVEMDGFGSHDGIIVIAATNRPDILDPALLRPGRFDRQITVNYPDIKGREEILKVHARNKPLEDSVDLATVAKTTAGFTGADLANLLNEASLLAARRGKSLVGMEDIEDAFIKIIAGPKKKSRIRKEEELKKTAYHEAGHAILAYALPSQDPVQQISIIPSGNALGYTLNPPKEDKHSVYKKELQEKIAMLLGGRAAEEIIFDDVSGGASNDIQRATDIAKKMVTQLGMSDVLGLRAFGSGHGEVFLGRDFSSTQDYSDETATKIDNEIHRIITEAYDNAKKILTENMEKLHFIAGFLVKNEIMDGEQFEAAMKGEPTYEELEEMTEAKKRRSREENEEKRRKEAAEARRRKEEEENGKEKVRIDGFDFGGGNLKVDEEETEEKDAAENEAAEDDDIIVDEDVKADENPEESENEAASNEVQDAEYESEDEKKDNDDK
ncbi:MAG: ATP-dependent zinc metalloprotease FtsH [Ruminococcaceae bacterium]|nr:ATP-dependent zinc metalloprotease FtsH [Oscillospiraceae bacterium]